MELEQIRNLISFTLMFNKQTGNKFLNSTSDIIMEKFKMFIGTDIDKKQHKKSNELENQLSLYFTKWDEPYYKTSNYIYTDDYFKFVNVFSYLFENQIINSYKDVTPENMIRNFNKYIGNSENIKKDMVYNLLLHPLLREQFIIPYIKYHERGIKILTIS